MRILYLGQADICGFYRTLGPLLRAGVEVIYPRTKRAVDWADLERCDVVCVPRASSTRDLPLLKYAKAAGKPTWVDLDDYLLGVPPSNPNWDNFSSPSTKDAIVKCLQEATLVTVSTPALAVAYKLHVDREYPVLRNALMFKPVSTPGSSKTLIWRGSSTHVADVGEFATQIAAGKPDDWAFEAFGAMPWQVLDAFKPGTDMHVNKVQPIYQYFNSLAAVQGRVGVVPLQDNTFNRCKSNIAALEMLAAGVLPVVPDWPEWRDLGCPLYTPRTLKDVLRVTCSRDTSEAWKKALKIAEDTHALATVNAARLDLLSRL